LRFPEPCTLSLLTSSISLSTSSFFEDKIPLQGIQVFAATHKFYLAVADELAQVRQLGD